MKAKIKEAKKTIAIVTFLFLFLVFTAKECFASNALLEFVFTINRNSTVESNLISVSFGESSVGHNSGNYSVIIYDSNQNEIWRDSYNLNFIIFSDPPSEGNSDILSDKISYLSSMRKIVIKYNDKEIFEKELNFCNNNKICETGENYLSCPSDCPLSKKDGLCIKDSDGICDPDCLPGYDSDCTQKINETTSTTLALGCGNKICDSTETYFSCPSDCPSGGRDGYCDRVADGKCDPDCSEKQDADCAKKAAAKEAMDPTTKALIAAIAAVIVVFIILFILIKMKTGSER